MIAPTKILVPVALSPACAWAAQYASHWARRFGSELLFLHIGNCQRETVEAFLAGPVQDTPHEISICQGDQADAIVQFACDTAVALIVMPTHSHGRFRRFLLGSVTAKVLHDVDCPVLTGIHQATAPLSTLADIHQIVCADSDHGFIPVMQGA